MNKYYFIPQFIGIIMDKLIFADRLENNINKVYQKYDFNNDPFPSVYQEML